MLYQWNSPESTINAIEVYAPHSKPEALFYAPANATTAQLNTITDWIRSHGFLSESDKIGDAYVLRVKQFGTAQDLLSLLSRDGIIKGTASQTATAFDTNKAPTITPARVSGAIHFVTDCALMVAGIMRGKGYGMGDFFAGLKFAIAGAMTAVMGQKNPDKQLGYIYKDLLETLDKNGQTLTAADRHILSSLSEKSGNFARIERFVRENPIPLNNLVQASGGLSMIKAGYDQKRASDDRPNHYKMAAGAFTTTGMISGIAIAPKEKTVCDAVPEEPQTTLGKLKEFFIERPLRITGTMSVASNLLRIISGQTEKTAGLAYLDETQVNGQYKTGTFKHAEHALQTRINSELSESASHALTTRFTHHKDTPFTTLESAQEALLNKRTRVEKSIGSAKIDLYANLAKIVANGAYALSSTNINADIKGLGMLDEVCNSIAHIIHRAPTSEHATLVQSMASLLSTQKGVDASDDTLIPIMTSKLEAISKNPWEQSRNQAAPQPTIAATPSAQPGTKIHTISPQQPVTAQAPQHALA